MILTLANAKTQLRLEPDFDGHDELLTTLIGAAQRSIERSYYCRLVSNQEELDALPDGQKGFIADDDIKLAAQMMVAHWYLNPAGAGDGAPSELGVEYLLFPLMEHTV